MSIFNMPRPSAFGQNLKPYDGAKLFFFEPGTTTDKTSFTTSAEDVAHTQPVVADAQGSFAAIYLSGLYKAVLKDKNDVQLWSEDNLQGRSGDMNIVGTFDSSTNSSNYPVSGQQGDVYRVTTGFTLASASGEHILQTRDFIMSNKDGATAIDADWDIIRGVVSSIGADALVDGANIATDCEKGTVFTVTLEDNRTLDNPTNKIPGQYYIWEITQDGGGSNTLAFGTDFDFQTHSTINPVGGSTTVIMGFCVSSTSIQCALFLVDYATSAEINTGTAEDKTINPGQLRDSIVVPKMWVNFDASSGTPVVNGSLNLTSITDNGAGDYTMNMTVAMVDTNYATFGTAHRRTAATGATAFAVVSAAFTKTTSAVRMSTHRSDFASVDFPDISLMLFGS